MTNIDIINVPQASAGMVSASFEGPGVIKYQEEIDSGGRLLVFKNGVEVDSVEGAAIFGTDKVIYLEDGNQTITFQFRNEFTHHEKDLTIRDFRFIPGWQVEVDVPGSSASVTPDKESYETGEVVTISVVVPEGSTFLRWTGSLAGGGSEVTESLSRHILATGHLSRVVSFAGFDWTTSQAQAWFVEDEGLVSPVRKPATIRNSVKTEVIGPATLILDWGEVNATPGQDPNPPALELWIDDQQVAVYDPPPLRYEDTIEIELTEGVHKLEVFNDKFQLYPGSDFYVQGGILDIDYKVDEAAAAERSYLSLFYDPVELGNIDLNTLSGDPDKDGINYLLERIFGFDPDAKEAGLPLQLDVVADGSGGGCLTIPFFTFANYFEGSLQISSDLRAWRTVDLNDPSLEITPYSELIGLLKLRVEYSKGNPRVFLRYVP